MITLNTLIRLFEKLTSYCFALASICCGLLVILTFEQVIARYFFNASSTALQELEWHLFGIVFLFSAAYCIKTDNHVRVDILYSRFSNRTQKIINALSLLLISIPAAGLLVHYGIDFTYDSFQMNEISPNPDGLGSRWIIKASIPLGFLLVILQCLAEVLKCVQSDEAT